MSRCNGAEFHLANEGVELRLVSEAESQQCMDRCRRRHRRSSSSPWSGDSSRSRRIGAPSRGHLEHRRHEEGNRETARGAARRRGAATSLSDGCHGRTIAGRFLRSPAHSWSSQVN